MENHLMPQVKLSLINVRLVAKSILLMILQAVEIMVVTLKENNREGRQKIMSSKIDTKLLEISSISERGVVVEALISKEITKSSMKDAARII